MITIQRILIARDYVLNNVTRYRLVFHALFIDGNRKISRAVFDLYYISDGWQIREHPKNFDESG